MIKRHRFVLFVDTNESDEATHNADFVNMK